MRSLYTWGVVALTLITLNSCKDFVFGKVVVAEKDNPLIIKKAPRTGADRFVAPVVTDTDLKNPDPEGALADWATCLVMFKEGHSHGGGKLHGNVVFAKAPWRQEEFVEVYNKAHGPEVKIDKESTITYIEREYSKEAPDYIRLIGGTGKMWGVCLYFFDKAGKLINDKILDQSSRYQIFYSISDVDSQGRPYEVMDVRHREGDTNDAPIPSSYFHGKTSFEARRAVTPNIFNYTYRDTWTHEDMGDGTRELFGIKLRQPFSRLNYADAIPLVDQDYVGLKGHIVFPTGEEYPEPKEWGLMLSNKRSYKRMTYLLPQFYLAVRVMKCPEGKKVVEPVQDNPNKKMCAPSHAPHPDSEWQEMIRFNIPIRVYASMYDSDPTNPDYNEPYYYQLGKEIGISAKQAFDATQNIQIHAPGSIGGTGFGAWFL